MKRTRTEVENARRVLLGVLIEYVMNRVYYPNEVPGEDWYFKNAMRAVLGTHDSYEEQYINVKANIASLRQVMEEKIKRSVQEQLDYQTKNVRDDECFYHGDDDEKYFCYGGANDEF